MTTHPLTTLIAALTLAACQPAPSTADTPAAPHNLIIYYHGDNIDALRRAVSTYGAEILYHYPNLHGIAVRIPAQKTLEDAETYFSRQPEINGVARDQIQQLQ
ncbi:MAG: hypothetical protein ACFN9G_05555 [Cardiobacterium sp.]|jgi:C-type cytochrome biogenesis protein